jgi:hypothetical protein
MFPRIGPLAHNFSSMIQPNDDQLLTIMALLCVHKYNSLQLRYQFRASIPMEIVSDSATVHTFVMRTRIEIA